MLDFKSLQSKFSLDALKSYDWRSLRRYASPQATEDLNDFLESLPQTVGQTMLIIAGITWAAAGVLGLFTTVQVQKLTEMRTELEEAQALKPVVPMVKDVPVDKGQVSEFVDKISQVYEGVVIKAAGSTITLDAKSTAFFGVFREAIGHVPNGGSGWRVNVDHLCVGRECGKNPLAASLKINKVSVERPK